MSRLAQGSPKVVKSRPNCEACKRAKTEVSRRFSPPFPPCGPVSHPVQCIFETNAPKCKRCLHRDLTCSEPKPKEVTSVSRDILKGFFQTLPPEMNLVPWATKYGNIVILRAALKTAEPGAINAKDAEGRTPLDIARAKMNRHLISFLQGRGALEGTANPGFGTIDPVPRSILPQLPPRSPLSQELPLRQKQHEPGRRQPQLEQLQPQAAITATATTTSRKSSSTKKKSPMTVFFEKYIESDAYDSSGEHGNLDEPKIPGMIKGARDRLGAAAASMDGSFVSTPDTVPFAGERRTKRKKSSQRRRSASGKNNSLDKRRTKKSRRGPGS